MSEKKQRFSLQQKMDEDEQIAKSNLVESPPFPKDLLIETTNACNHRCVFCAQPKMTRTKKVMPKEKVVSILQEARKLGAEKVGLYSGAEPLADKNLIDYIKITKALGYTYIYISTNGAIGKNDKFKEIIDAGLDSIKFSFNAGTRESYKIVHGRDDWDQVVSNIRFVSEYRKKNNLDINLSITSVVLPAYKHECTQINQLFDHLVDDIYFADYANQAGYMVNENLDPITKPMAAIKAPCYQLFNRVVVTCEGYMRLCCVDYQNYLALADINYTSLMEAWNSTEFKTMRRRHLANDLKGTLCYNCINNENTKIEPLKKELATLFDFGPAKQNVLNKSK